MTKLRAPTEKLPLVTRKNLRDAWESAKHGFEVIVCDMLGKTWSIEVNPNLLYSYAGDDYKSRLGDVITWYIEPFIDNLKRFTDSFGTDGIQELNSKCPKHQLILAPQDKTDFTYGGLLVEDGALRLVFAEDCLAVNVGDISEDFARALKDAPSSAAGDDAFNLVARNAVRHDYDPKIEEVRTAIAALVNMPHLKLNPSFRNNAAALAASAQHVADEWDKRIGWITLSYFESLENVLKREKFNGDDMQQEAFQEAVEMGEVCVRILPKWDDGEGRYNELKVDEGVLYIQTTIDCWGVNVDDAALGLLDIL